MQFLQGDIVVIDYPFTDQSGTKRRPAIIISNSVVNKTRDIILAAITSQEWNDEFSFQLNKKNLKTPLHSNCEIRCHKLFLADKGLVYKKISALKDDAKVLLYSKLQQFLEVT